MRSVICWLAWMLYWTVLAAGVPSFFPEWFQSFITGFGLGSGIFGCAYAYHVSLLRDDIKRLETKITEIEKPTQNQPLYESSPSQETLEPVSVVKVSEENVEAPKLFPAGLTDYSPSQTELKIQALKTANEIYRTIEEAKRQARQTTSGLEIGVHFLYKVRPDDLKSLEYKNILDSTLSYYSKDLHNTAVELKLKIFVQNQIRFLPVSNYANPVDLYALEAIANDLRDIASAQNEQV